MPKLMGYAGLLGGRYTLEWPTTLTTYI